MSETWGKRLLVVMVFAAVVVPSASVAQDRVLESGREPIVIGETVTVHSNVLGMDRPLMIRTPRGYDESSERYPVVYVLDAESNFLEVSAIVEHLFGAGRMPVAIVVGVGSIDNARRIHDMTPQATRAETAWMKTFVQRDIGGASDYLRFLRDEVRPWVDSQYRTVPYGILVGGSLAGMFAVHALIEDPDAFQAYIATSPSLWWDDGTYVEKATATLAAHPDLKGAIYLTMADERGSMLAAGFSLAGILEMSAPDSFRWKWTLMPNEDHGSTGHRARYDGLEWLFEGWALQDPIDGVVEGGDEGWARIEAHYSGLTERFGYTIKPPEDLVDEIADVLGQRGRHDESIRAFELNRELHPGSARVFNRLGDAYRNACRLEEAREAYATAYRMAQATSHPDAGSYGEDLELLTAQIESGRGCVPADKR